MLEVRFKLTEKSKKDQMIMKLFENEYNVNEAIKGILYKIALSVNESKPITLAGGVKVVYNLDSATIDVNSLSTSDIAQSQITSENITTNDNQGNDDKSNENDIPDIKVGNDLAKMFEN